MLDHTVYCTYRQQGACRYEANDLIRPYFNPVRKIDGSRKLRSNPKGLDLRKVQPVTVQLISVLGWLNICNTPAATIGRNNRDPLVVRRDLNVWGIGFEDGGLHNAHERVQKEGRERDARDI